MNTPPATSEIKSVFTTENCLFGVENITGGKVVEFRYGLPGFESLSKFVVADVKDYSPFKILQSIEDPDVSLLILNIDFLKMPMDARITIDKMKNINNNGCNQEGEVEIYVILRYDKAIKAFSANMKAPLVVNFKNQVGKQIILEDENLSVHHTLTLI